MGKWVKSGAPWVWLNAAAVSVSLLLVIGLLSLIAARGMGHFWPAAVYEVVYGDHQGQRTRLAGQITQRERRLQLDGVTETAPYDELNRRREGFQAEYLQLEEQLTGLNEAINRDTVIM